MRESLIDTDILSYYFKGDTKVTERFTQYLDYYDKINISFITYFEIMSGLYISDARSQLKRFEKFCETNNIFNVTLDSISISSRIISHLQHKGTIVDNQDVLIAGIALEQNLIVATNNEKHFARIPELIIDNWKKK